MHWFVHPLWFQDIGAFTKEENIEVFVEWAKLAFTLFGALCGASAPLLRTLMHCHTQICPDCKATTSLLSRQFGVLLLHGQLVPRANILRLTVSQM